MGCFGTPGIEGSVITAFNLLAVQRYVLYRLSGSGGGNSGIYNNSLPTTLERMGRLVCSRGCTKQ